MAGTVAAAFRYFSQSPSRMRQIRLESLVARRRPLLISISRNRRQTPASAAHSGNDIIFHALVRGSVEVEVPAMGRGVVFLIGPGEYYFGVFLNAIG